MAALVSTPLALLCRLLCRLLCSQHSGVQQGGIIEQVQREEEGHLRRALREYNLRRGHKSAT